MGSPPTAPSGGASAIHGAPTPVLSLQTPEFHGYEALSLLPQLGMLVPESPRPIDRMSLVDFSTSDYSTNLASGQCLKSQGREPCAWLSPCSDAGVNWVCGATESHSFVKIADRFMRRMEQHSPASTLSMSYARGMEPPETTAWEYVNGKLCCLETLPGCWLIL